MTLSARAIAVQGIGFAAAVLAVQGFASALVSVDDDADLPVPQGGYWGYYRPSPRSSKRRRRIAAQALVALILH